MKIARLAAGLALALTLTGAARADASAVSFGAVGYGGTGCPEGTGHVITAPDGQSATLVLDGYSVGTGEGGVDRKACALAVPVTVPAGMAVAIRSLALRGQARLPAGATATLSVEPFLAGATGTPQTRALSGPLDMPLTQLVSLPDTQLDWSACGGAVTLRVNTSLRMQPAPGSAVTLSAINLYRLATKAC
jgi:hypothetical protein